MSVVNHVGNQQEGSGTRMPAARRRLNLFGFAQDVDRVEEELAYGLKPTAIEGLEDETVAYIVEVLRLLRSETPRTRDFKADGSIEPGGTMLNTDPLREARYCDGFMRISREKRRGRKRGSWANAQEFFNVMTADLLLWDGKTAEELEMAHDELEILEDNLGYALDLVYRYASAAKALAGYVRSKGNPGAPL